MYELGHVEQDLTEILHVLVEWATGSSGRSVVHIGTNVRVVECNQIERVCWSRLRDLKRLLFDRLRLKEPCDCAAYARLMERGKYPPCSCCYGLYAYYVLSTEKEGSLRLGRA